MPRPWPELQWPTSEQWLDWLLDNDRDGQLVIAERALRDSQAAARRLDQDHAAALYQVQHHGEQLTAAFECGRQAAFDALMAELDADRVRREAEYEAAASQPQREA